MSEEAKTRKESRQEREREFNRLRNLARQKMQDSLLQVARTKGGLHLLRYLAHECGFASSLGGVNTQGVDKDIITWNASRRQVYLDLRQFMTADVINLVELDQNKEDKNDDGRPSKFE